MSRMVDWMMARPAGSKARAHADSQTRVAFVAVLLGMIVGAIIAPSGVDAGSDTVTAALEQVSSSASVSTVADDRPEPREAMTADQDRS